MSVAIELDAANVGNDNTCSDNTDDEAPKSPTYSFTPKQNTLKECPRQTKYMDKAMINANELDRFKRRLIRIIVRSMLVEKKPEERIWRELKKETLCDCKLLWSRMRAVTLKKLKRLIAAEDKIDNITKIAQLTVTDWLLYDLVLVHENVDVIGQEEKDESKRQIDLKIMEDLFQLVMKYKVENLRGQALTNAWYDLTQEYNTCGRKCSPMLLQRRWFQLKEQVWYNFYNFWYTYRGDVRRLPDAMHYKPTNLQTEIIKRYNQIVTEEFPSWEKLIEEKKVSLHADFERLHLSRRKAASKENEPDLVVIEPHVETIDLRIESDNESDSSIQNENTIDEVDISIVKTETVDIMSDKDDDDVCVLESVQIPIETQVLSDKEDGENEIDDFIESNAVITVNYGETNGNTIDISKEIITSDQPHVDHLYEKPERLKEDTKTKIEIEIDIERLDKEGIKKDIEQDEVKDVIKVDIQNMTDTKLITEPKLELETVSDCNSQSSFNGISFIDGLELEDEGIEYFEEDDSVPERAYGNTGNSEDLIDINDVGVSKIDFKLLLNPVVETKRLDDMDVFRFIDFNSVKDSLVIQKALLENLPPPKKIYNINEISDKCQLEYENNYDDEDSNQYDNEKKINIKSWYFRKPKVCTYNPIQLCKNPDFNTRLKRLTAGFFSSERNRRLLKECKPVTIDMHKSFEVMLRNNSLLVTDHDKLKTNCDKTFVPSTRTINITKTAETIAPDIETTTLAIIDNISLESCIQDCKDSSQSTIPQRYSPTMATLTPNTIKKDISQIDENNIINLTDIEKICLANNKLLVAEVSPIQNLNNTSKPSVRLISNKQMNVESIANLNKKPAVSLLRPIKLNNNINTIRHRQALVKNTKNGYKEPIGSDILEKPNVKIAKPKPTEPPPQPSKIVPEFVKKGVPTDRLLALDTVERILKVCQGDLSHTVNKKKIFRHSKRKQIFCKNNKLSAESQAICEVPIIMTDVSDETVDLCSKNTTPNTLIDDSTRTCTTGKKRKYNSYCCWYNKKWKHLTNKNIRPKEHPCPPSQCTCCCKEEYEIKLLYAKNSTTTFSRVASGQNKKIKQYKASKTVTTGMNTVSNPEFSVNLLEASKTNYGVSKKNTEVFSYNKALSENESQLIHTINTEPGGFCMSAPNPIITSVQSLSQAIETSPVQQEDSDVSQTKCKTNLIYSAGPYYLHPPELNKCVEEPTNKFNMLAVNKVLAMDNQFKKTLPQSPISLGKNKILLCSLKPVNNPVENIVEKNILQPEIINDKNLPSGVHITLFQNNELKLSIDHGTELNSTQLKKLPAILTAIQKELDLDKSLRQVLTNHSSDKKNFSVAWDSLVSLLNAANSFNMSICDQTANGETIGVCEGPNNELSELVTNDYDIPTVESVIECASEPISKNTTDSIECDSEPMEKINETNSENRKEDVLDEETTSIPDENPALEQVILKDKTAIENEENVATTSTQDSGKKTILSDLMEMSGISFEDTFASNNETPEVTVEDTSNRDINILNTQIIDNSLINYSSILHNTTPINDDTYNVASDVPDKSIVKTNLGAELNIVTSFNELKYAYANSAQFYKMDIDTGKIVSINVKIKTHNPPIEKSTPLHTKTVIDLTDECEKDEQDIPSANMETPELVKSVQLNKAFKPLILKRGRNNRLQKFNEGELSTKRKEKIIRIIVNENKDDSNTSNQDKVSRVPSPEISKTNDNPTSESDDEPLASKAKRKKKVIEDFESKCHEENTCDKNDIENIDNPSNSELNSEGTTKNTTTFVKEPETISKNSGDDATERKPTYKYCIVPLCKNTVRNAPNKIFFLVPRGEAIRKQWCEIMKRSMVSSSTCLYCCEDHFDLEEDTANYIQYKIMNLQEKQKTILRLKKGVVPHKFQCQKETDVPSESEKHAYKNRKHAQIIEETSASTSNRSDSTLKLISD